MGDVFNVGPNSTVVNRSYINNSLNAIGGRLDSQSRAALDEFTQWVLNSENPEAAESLEGFIGELNTDNPRKGVLNSLLNGIVAALPSLASAAALVENIRRIIAGI